MRTIPERERDGRCGWVNKGADKTRQKDKAKLCVERKGDQLTKKIYEI
jgi:hypothetical protein